MQTCYTYKEIHCARRWGREQPSTIQPWLPSRAPRSTEVLYTRLAAPRHFFLSSIIIIFIIFIPLFLPFSRFPLIRLRSLSNNLRRKH